MAWAVSYIFSTLFIGIKQRLVTDRFLSTTKKRLFSLVIAQSIVKEYHHRYQKWHFTK
jgi:hypothetical protein